MLLRRVTQHVQSQNWFAVLVDFVIVVVGVFVGLQVQDWNDERKAKQEEQMLLDRLNAETRKLLGVLDEDLAKLRTRGEILVGVNPVLFSQQPPRAITRLECAYIAGSHAHRRPSDELPVLDEMLETGRFDLLRNPATKETLRSYLMLRERARAYYAEAVNEMFRLHSRFPSLIAVRRVPITDEHDRAWGGLSGDGFLWMPECDVEGMRANTAFLNEYMDNLSRINSMTDFVVQRRAHLVELERLLDDRPTQSGQNAHPTVDVETGH